MSELQVQWQMYSARFAVLQPREKYLVVGAIAVAILFVGYSLAIEPAMLRKSVATKMVSQYRSDLATLGPQVEVLRAQLKDPDAPLRTGIADVKKQMADLDRKLGGFDKVLVSSDKVPALLQSLMSRHRGLDLVSLKTLPPQPVIQRNQQKQEAKAAVSGDGLSTQSAADMANIYRHGIEIKISGSYQDLLAYVSEIEQSPQRLLMGGMQLDATKYPHVELTLLVYTLSLDRAWLVL